MSASAAPRWLALIDREATLILDKVWAFAIAKQ